MAEIQKLTLLSPAPHLCPQCAVKHLPEQAHDAISFYYAFWFNEQYGKAHTWADAIAHCPVDIKAVWFIWLNKVGIDVNSTDVRGGIRTDADLNARLTRQTPVSTDAVLGGAGPAHSDAVLG